MVAMITVITASSWKLMSYVTVQLIDLGLTAQCLKYWKKKVAVNLISQSSSPEWSLRYHMVIWCLCIDKWLIIADNLKPPNLFDVGRWSLMWTASLSLFSMSTDSLPRINTLVPVDIVTDLWRCRSQVRDNSCMKHATTWRRRAHRLLTRTW